MEKDTQKYNQIKSISPRKRQARPNITFLKKKVTYIMQGNGKLVYVLY